MNDVIRPSKERNILDLAKNLQDDLHVYCKGAAGSGDNFYARTFANLADRADELVKLLESAPETRACVAMREAGKHVFCGATPNWIDHAGDCDALPCICGLSEWLNTNKDLLGITLSHSQKAGDQHGG